MNRRTNIELLRIIAMLGIVIAHLIGYSPEVSQMFSAAGTQTLYLSILSCAGKIGVHIFFMITGYFLISKSFRLVRICKVWKTVWIYSMLALLVALLFVPSSVGGASRIIQSIFPITTDTYWFVTTYIIIILLSPAINYLLKKVDSPKKILVFFFCVAAFYLANFAGKLAGIGFGFDLISSHRLLTYSITYSVGALFALHPPNISFCKRLLLLFLAGSCLVAWRVVMLHLINIRGYDLWVIDDRDIFVFLVACSLFLLFSGLTIKNNAIVNKIAGATFAVYLIHENCFLRPIIWNTFDIYSSFGGWFLYIYPLTFGIIILLSCSVFEILRQSIDKKLSQFVRLRHGQ